MGSGGCAVGMVGRYGQCGTYLPRWVCDWGGCGESKISAESPHCRPHTTENPRGPPRESLIVFIAVTMQYSLFLLLALGLLLSQVFAQELEEGVAVLTDANFDEVSITILNLLYHTFFFVIYSFMY